MGADGRRSPPSLPSPETVLADAAASRSLKAVLSEWLSRDAVDAARDAELLADVLGRRADRLLGIIP